MWTKSRYTPVILQLYREGRACSHACKLVDGIYEVASTRELINVGMRSVVLCGNCEDVAVDCVA